MLLSGIISHVDKYYEQMNKDYEKKKKEEEMKVYNLQEVKNLIK